MRSSDDLLNLVQGYIQKAKGEEAPLFEKAKAAAQNIDKDRISISRTEGEMLQFFIQIFKCQKFIEIGTLTGYSALWILKGLSENGELWTFEKDVKHARVAREILDEAILDPQFAGKKYHLIEGDAEAGLPSIEGQGPFDGIFIDGNKSAYGRYLDWAKRNVKKGGLIICDNVFLAGAVLGDHSKQAQKFSDKQVSVMNKVNQQLLAGPDFLGVLIPTSEGMAIAIRL